MSLLGKVKGAMPTSLLTTALKQMGINAAKIKEMMQNLIPGLIIGVGKIFEAEIPEADRPNGFELVFSLATEADGTQKVMVAAVQMNEDQTYKVLCVHELNEIIQTIPDEALNFEKMMAAKS